MGVWRKSEFRRGRKYRPIRNLTSASITNSAIGVFTPCCSNERDDTVGTRAGYIVWCWVFFRLFVSTVFIFFFVKGILKYYAFITALLRPFPHVARSLVLLSNSGTAESKK